VLIYVVQTQSKDWAFSNKDKNASGEEFSHGGSDGVWAASLIPSKLISSCCCHYHTENMLWPWSSNWNYTIHNTIISSHSHKGVYYMQLDFVGLEEGGVTYLAWMKCGVP